MVVRQCLRAPLHASELLQKLRPRIFYFSGPTSASKQPTCPSVWDVQITGPGEGGAAAAPGRCCLCPGGLGPWQACGRGQGELPGPCRDDDNPQGACCTQVGLTCFSAHGCASSGSTITGANAQTRLLACVPA